MVSASCACYRNFAECAGTFDFAGTSIVMNMLDSQWPTHHELQLFAHMFDKDRRQQLLPCTTHKGRDDCSSDYHSYDSPLLPTHTLR